MTCIIPSGSRPCLLNTRVAILMGGEALGEGDEEVASRTSARSISAIRGREGCIGRGGEEKMSSENLLRWR